MNYIHLEACPMYDDLLIQGPIVLANEVILDGIDESEILRVCLRTKGAGGVSGLDAELRKKEIKSSELLLQA